MKNLIVEDVFRDIEIKQRIKVVDRMVNVPTKYFGNVFMGAFPISTKKAKEVINTNRLKPIEIKPGKSIVALTIFNNHDTPVDPYKEIVVSIPVLCDARVSIPLLPFLIKSLFRNSGFYVLTVASDTSLSREEGNIIFGYPHYEGNINVEFIQNESNFYAKLDEAGKNILSIRVNKIKREKIEQVDYQTYFTKNNNLYRIEMNTVAIVGRSFKKSDGILELGSHVISQTLKNLEIDPKPVEISYYRNSIEILNPPIDLGKA